MPAHMDNSISTRLCFAWKASYPAHATGPWQIYDFPVFFHLINEGIVKVYFENDEIHTMRSGDVLCFPPNRRRRVELIESEPGNRLQLGIVGISFLLQGNMEITSLWNMPVVFPQETAEVMGSAINDLIKLEQSRESLTLPDNIRCSEICMNLLVQAVSCSEIKPDTETRLEISRTIEPAIKKLHKFEEDISIPVLARSCNMSKSLFHQKFKQIHETSPLEYQLRMRLSEAKRLLLTTGLSVAEIGLCCGWKDQFHFSRIFKDKTGFSPTAYRDYYSDESSPYL